jgi:hypothetical protein
LPLAPRPPHPQKAVMTIRSAGPAQEAKPAPETKPAVETGGGRFKRALIVLLVVAASIAIAYGAGRLQTSSAIDAAEAKAAEALKAKSLAEEQLGQAQGRLEARRRLHLAVLELEARNFGTAEQHLSAAAALLAKSKPDGELEKLRAELAGARLKASDDVAAQRAKIAGWISRFDALVPPAQP